MFDLLFNNPLVFLYWFVALIIAVTLHEFAHAFVADKLGDPTPRMMGRVSLNPLDHLDPIGTIAILIAHIGWGKPVPFDPYNLDNPKRDTLLIAVAGPVVNLILAIISALLLHLNLPIIGLLSGFLLIMVYLNVGLAIFNLLPIPPLDGSKILQGILPDDKSQEWEIFSQRYGLMLLLFFLFPFGGSSIAGAIISPIINIISALLLG